MYVKLILRNAVRSIKDYLVYIVTLTLCVAMFYAFMSITSNFYHPDIGAEYDITILAGGLKLAVISITCLMVFLVNYVNHYMIQRRQKEFALQTIMGMERRITAGLFFAETLCMGIAALVIGILLGSLLSQFITAMLLSAFGREYRVSWMLFPDTAVISVVFFMLCFSVIGLWNIRAIKRISIIDMLSASHQNEDSFGKSKWVVAIIIAYLLLIANMLKTALIRMPSYLDIRNPFPVKIMVWGNILAPAMALLAALLYCIMKRKHVKVQRLVLLLMVTVLPIMGFMVLIPLYKIRYYLPMGANMINQYMLYMLGEVSFLICAAVYLSVYLVSRRKGSITHKYEGENLFFYGQILSRLQTALKSMTLISITLAFSIGMFMIEPILTGWIAGYLDMRAVFEVQIVSGYNKVNAVENLAKDDYEYVTEYLMEHGVEITQDCLFPTYLLQRDSIHNEENFDFPKTAIALSDYNVLRSMRGLEPVSLKEGEFTTQWNITQKQEMIDKFLTGNKEIVTDEGILRQAEKGAYYADLGEMIYYTTYVEMLYVLPDEVCGKLLAVSSNRFLNTKEPIPYETAIKLQDDFQEKYSFKEEGNTYLIRTRSEQVSHSTAGYFVLKIGMLYGAIILMISCFTILALQQLSEADRFGFRFGVLRKLGVDEENINRLVVKQIAFWFGLPISIAVLAAGAFVCYVALSVSIQIGAYIGTETLLLQLGAIAAILLVLFLCYFVSTWLLFKRSIDR